MLAQSKGLGIVHLAQRRPNGAIVNHDHVGTPCSLSSQSPKMRPMNKHSSRQGQPPDSYWFPFPIHALLRFLCGLLLKMRACFEQKQTERTEQQAAWFEIAGLKSLRNLGSHWIQIHARTARKNRGFIQ